MHSFPSCMEEIVPTFLDDTPIDTKYVANDNNQSSTNWECANIGIGAFLHEVGHLLGCPHRPSGIMHRDYLCFNRSFCTKESYSVRTKTRPWGPCLPDSECTWHRLDLVRFRYHPLFGLPSDPPANDTNLFYYPVKDGLHVVSCEGVVLIEIYIGDHCHGHIEFCDSPRKDILLREAALRDHANLRHRNEPLRVLVLSAALRELVIHDFAAELSSSSLPLALGLGTRSGILGHLNPAFPESTIDFSDRLHTLTEIRMPPPLSSNSPSTIHLTCPGVRSGLYIDGIGFLFADHSSTLLSGRGGSLHAFPIDGPRGERISAFYVWSAVWIDALQVATSWGRTRYVKTRFTPC